MKHKQQEDEEKDDQQLPKENGVLDRFCLRKRCDVGASIRGTRGLGKSMAERQKRGVKRDDDDRQQNDQKVVEGESCGGGDQSIRWISDQSSRPADVREDGFRDQQGNGVHSQFASY